MARVTVTTSHTVRVDRSPNDVFDFTQDYSKRTTWDSSVKSAAVVSEEPRRILLEMNGIGRFLLEYKLFRRGGRTSAAFRDVANPLFSGGGGSWSYDAADGGTNWTQTSTFEFKNRLVGWLLGPLLRWNMNRLTAEAMTKAKDIMESAPTPR